MNRKKIQKITNLLRDKLNYTDISGNLKLIICFAGIPSSGKTTLSKILEKRYNGLRIEGDLIMRTISENNLSDSIEETEKIKADYFRYLTKQNPFKNNLLIFDRGIERHYEVFIKDCKDANMDYFLIQLEITKQKSISRIKKRNSEDYLSWINRLDKWFDEYNDFKKRIKSDIVLDATSPDLNELFLLLDNKLSY